MDSLDKLRGVVKKSAELVKPKQGLSDEDLQTLGQMFAKFNPYHDELGRFTNAPNAVSTSPGTSRGADFVSPNKGELSYKEAKNRLESQEQSLLLKYSDKINRALGIKGSTASVVGAWADGAENSTVGLYDDNVSYEAIRAASSLKGLIEKQKAVIAFKARKGGTARLTEVLLGGSIDDHHKAMLDFGIEFHTLQPTKTGVTAWVFQEKSDSKLNGLIKSYAKGAGGKVKAWAGDGDFIGSWTSREEGAKAYLSEIDKYVKANPKTKPKIEKVLADWRKRAGQ
jgi:hypothetical protein